MKITQVMKWIGYLDGAVVAGAMAFGKAAPQYQPIVDSVVEVGTAITATLGVWAHLVAGSQTVGQ